jgi:hypothetical protein
MEKQEEAGEAGFPPKSSWEAKNLEKLAETLLPLLLHLPSFKDPFAYFLIYKLY